MPKQSVLVSTGQQQQLTVHFGAHCGNGDPGEVTGNGNWHCSRALKSGGRLWPCWPWWTAPKAGQLTKQSHNCYYCWCWWHQQHSWLFSWLKERQKQKLEIVCVCVCTGRHYHSKCITSSSQYLNLLSSTVRVFYGQRQPTAAAAPLFEVKTKTYYYLLFQSCQSKLLIYLNLCCAVQKTQQN